MNRALTSLQGGSALEIALIVYCKLIALKQHQFCCIGLLACLSYSSPQLMGPFVNKQNNNNDDLMYSRWRSRRLRKVRSRPRQILLESVVRYRSCPQFSIRILFISTKVRPNIIHNYEGKTEYYSYLRR